MSTKKHVINISKILIPLAIGVYLTWHFYSAMDAPTKKVFYHAIGNANYFWIILSMVMGFVSHLLRASRWKYMLEPIGYKTKFWHRYHSLMIGYLVNLLVPRAGEVTRAGMLYQTDKVPFSKSFGTIIAERMFDLLMLGIVFAITLSLSLDDLMAIKNIVTSNSSGSGGAGSGWLLNLLISILIGAIILFCILWVKIETFRNKVKTFLHELLNGVLSILKSKNPIKFTIHTLLIWILYVVFFGICFQSFPATQNFPIDGILIGFIAGTIGLMFTNGGIGAYPFLVGVVVVYFIGDSGSKETVEGIGKALGMIIWLSQTLMLIFLGLISLIFLPRNYKKEKNDEVGTNKA